MTERAYPAPKPGEEGYIFFMAWGYEQWLVKTYQADMESLRVRESTAYNAYRMDQVLGKPPPATAQELEARLAGLNLPVVRATTAIRGWFTHPVTRGMCGVQLWREADGTPFCFFPYGRGGLDKPYIGPVHRDHVACAQQTFSSWQQLIDVMHPGHVASTAGLKGCTITLPGRDGPWYVTKSGCEGYLEVVPAVPRARGGGMKGAPGVKPQRVHLRNSEVDEIIVQEAVAYHATQTSAGKSAAAQAQAAGSGRPRRRGEQRVATQSGETAPAPAPVPAAA